MRRALDGDAGVAVERAHRRERLPSGPPRIATDAVASELHPVFRRPMWSEASRSTGAPS